MPSFTGALCHAARRHAPRSSWRGMPKQEDPNTNLAQLGDLATARVAPARVMTPSAERKDLPQGDPCPFRRLDSPHLILGGRQASNLPPLLSSMP